MNKALCSLQVLWGVLFSVTSLGKILCYRPEVWNQTLSQLACFFAVPQPLFVFIGVCEFLGGVGLILSATTAVKPKLTPPAATGRTLVVILAAIFHIGRGEYNFLPRQSGAGRGRRVHRVWTVVGEANRARFDQPPGVLKGLAVVGALVLVWVAPGYRAAHIH